MARQPASSSEKQFQKEMVDQFDAIARALVHLGKGTSYEPGAVEFLAMQVRDGLNNVASAIHSLADAINHRS